LFPIGASLQKGTTMATPDITGGFDCEESKKSKAVEESLQKLVHKGFASAGPSGQKIKNFLNGTWLGHPLHVILTDVPIGAWTTALVCDALQLVSGRDDFATAADTSVTIGIAGALCAAVTGVTDWQDADAPARRLGMIHGILNLSGTALFAASLISRKRRSRTAGRILSVLGYGVMTTAARLGGKMVYEHRVGVDRTAGETFPADFVSVLAESELAESQPKRAEHDGVPILLVRRGTRVFALAETCSHFSGPLSEGKLAGDTIECPWHHSRFALEDGRVLDGPAVHPQPCLETRVRNGRIEVRKPICKTRVVEPGTAGATELSKSA
jgi:nitrite reductase/ring-hydroxylating ferredoxin subunit/uncharacterized membrane protein